MKIISIGRFVEKLDYKTNIQDYGTWKAMAKYFDDIYIVIQSPDKDNHCEEIDKLHVYWIGQRGNSLFDRVHFMTESYKLSLKLIEEHNIDVINVSEPVVAGIPSVKLKKKTERPLLVQVQGQLLNLPRGTYSKAKEWYIRKSTQYTCKRADVIRTVSYEIAEQVKKLGIPDYRVKAITARCNVVKFDPVKYVETRQQLRNKLGYKDSDIVIEFTGRIIEHRDLESDLRALHILLKKSERYRFLIVGTGPDEERLRKITKELGIERFVLFNGKVPFDDMPAYLSAGDIFISTTTNEAIARSVLEAMAMELPVVATRVGGTPEAIKDGVTGMLVDVKSPDQIAQKIELIATNDSLRKEIGKKAREVIVSRYEEQELIRQFAEIHYNIEGK